MLCVRELTAEEAGETERLTRSRTEEARLVERASIVVQAGAGKSAPLVTRELGVSEKMVRRWLSRCPDRRRRVRRW